MADLTITAIDDARECYRQKDLRQALYDAGEVITEDVDPEEAHEMDASSSHPYFGHYPVIFPT